MLQESSRWIDCAPSPYGTAAPLVEQGVPRRCSPSLPHPSVVSSSPSLGGGGGECEPYKPQSLLNQVAKLKGYIHEAHLIKQDPQY